MQEELAKMAGKHGINGDTTNSLIFVFCVENWKFGIGFSKIIQYYNYKFSIPLIFRQDSYSILGQLIGSVH